ncbi:MAG: hypothetical protein ACI9CQ_004635 [Saprospiraceae bacterium]|jgi:hypothetical protein
MARLAYSRKNFDGVFLLLQKVNYKDILFNLAIKTIALKTYFELGEIDLLESHMDAMQNYIRRKKDIGYHRELYSNLFYQTGIRKSCKRKGRTKSIVRGNNFSKRSR